jgi:hypothetical protein
MDPLITAAIADAAADLLAATPAIIVAGLGIGVAFWGAPKLFGLLKRTSK